MTCWRPLIQLKKFKLTFSYHIWVLLIDISNVLIFYLSTSLSDLLCNYVRLWIDEHCKNKLKSIVSCWFAFMVVKSIVPSIISSFLQIHKDLDIINHWRRSKISDEIRFRQPIYHGIVFAMHLTRVFNAILHNHITLTSCNKSWYNIHTENRVIL